MDFQNKNIIVQKYGGSSLTTLDQIRNIAEKIVNRKKEGNQMVIVVSARGNMTDKLLKEAKELSFPNPIHLREADMLMSVGERISISIISIAINALGCEATSLTGSQCGIITDTNHTNAKILEIRPARIIEALNKDKIVIAAGFQGVSTEKEITTLGRGGSDLTAISLAISLKAKQCEIYSDVEGICDSNPKDNPQAKLLKTITSEEMVEMALTGAKVIDINGAKLWQKYANKNLKLKISDSKTQGSGTIVTHENMTGCSVTAINIIKDTIVAETSIQNKNKVLESFMEFNLLPVMLFKSNHKFSLVLEKEACEIALTGMPHLFENIKTDHVVISAVGKNIGTDIGTITLWEDIMDTVDSSHTSYSANKIVTLLKKSDLDEINGKIYETFLHQ